MQDQREDIMYAVANYDLGLWRMQELHREADARRLFKLARHARKGRRS